MNHERTRSIVEKLKAARLAKGMSQRDLASLTGTLQSHVSRIESNAVDIRLSSLLTIAHALDLDLSLVPSKSLRDVGYVAQTEQREEKVQFSVQRKFEQMRQTVYQLHAKNPDLEIFDRLSKCLTELEHFEANIPDIIDVLESISRKIDQLGKSDNQIEVRAEVLLRQLNWLKKRTSQKPL